MVTIGIIYALSKFECHLSSYKQDKEFKILYSVNEARILILLKSVFYLYQFQSNIAFIVDNIIYNNTESVNFVCQE